MSQILLIIPIIFIFLSCREKALDNKEFSLENSKPHREFTNQPVKSNPELPFLEKLNIRKIGGCLVGHLLKYKIKYTLKLEAYHVWFHKFLVGRLRVLLLILRELKRINQLLFSLKSSRFSDDFR